jgi:hypothetical protein
MRQPTFFERESKAGERDVARIILYALGEFQQRGKVLAERDLPFDRLRGAFRRAAEAFDTQELGDEETASALSALGANVRRVPVFFAKHPFRVVVPASLAERAHAFFLETKKTD